MTAIAVPRRTPNVLAVAAGAAFLALLDTTVANLAVADVRTDFAGASVSGATWIITDLRRDVRGVSGARGPRGRRRGPENAPSRGRRRLHAAVSLLCALAPSLEALLVARGLQGAAAAAMIPASLAVVLSDTPPERRAAAIGAWSAAGALAAAAGPALGGVLVDTVGWRSLFLINVPVGARDRLRRALRPRRRARRPAARTLVGTVAARARHRRRRARHRAGLGVGVGRPAHARPARRRRARAPPSRCAAPSRSPRRRWRPRCGARRGSPPPTSPRCSTAPRCSRGC